MPPIKSVINRLERIKKIHEKKNEDYTEKDAFENFDRSGVIGSWFSDPAHKSFAILIGTKLTRLATLLNKKAAPNNESIEDSFDDLTTYCALFGAYVEGETNKAEELCDYCLLPLSGKASLIETVTGRKYHIECFGTPTER